MANQPELLGVIAPHPPIMVSEVGGARTSVTAASIEAMRRAAGVLDQFGPETLVVMSPHAPAVADAFAVDTAVELSGSLAQFGAPRSRIVARTDVEFARALLGGLEESGLPALERSSDRRLAAGTLDHGVLVPLSFLDPDGTLPLVVLSLSGLSLGEHHRAGAVVASVATALGRRCAFVASGDLSHCLTPDAPAGYAPRAARFDAAVVDLVERSQLDELLALDPTLVAEAGECGLRSFVTLAGALSAAAAEPHAEVLAYEGPWGVGYLTALAADLPIMDALDLGTNAEETPAAGRKGGAAGEDAHPIVRLARSIIETHVRGEEPPRLSLPDDPALPARSGAFVTLHLGGSLRGCIGTLAPTCSSLAEEVAANAIKAASEDPRFPPVTPDELPGLEVGVDVLHPPESASVTDLDPARYGVIVTSGWRRGLLLPDLEGVDSVEQQVDIARRKAGISEGKPVELERFRVDRYA